MAEIHPFRALRPRPEAAARVASVPYDVVDADEARALAAGNPDSFLHVVRAEIDLPPAADPHGEAVYRRAAESLADLVGRGVLVRDPEPVLYLYRQVWRGRAQTGIVGCCSVAEYDRGLIKRHEHTRPDKELDRTRHALAIAAHAGPVFTTYRGRPEIDRRVAEAAAAEPLYDFTAADGVRHTVWRLSVADSAALAAALAAVPVLYIADGHHRAAAYSRVHREFAAAAEKSGGGIGEADGFLAVLFPAAELAILPYNRVVSDLGGHSPDDLGGHSPDDLGGHSPDDLGGRSTEDFLRALGEVMAVTPDGAPEPAGRGRFAMYLAGRWYGLEAPSERLDDPDPVSSLDAAILQDLVLGPLLGIDDPRTSDRIEFVGGVRGSEELVRRVDARGGGAAFALHPLTVEQLMAVADAGRVLPPKSTWFEPKLRSGLLVHEFSGAAP